MSTASDAIKFMRDTAILTNTDAASRIYVSGAPQSATYPLVVVKVISMAPSPTQDRGSEVDTFRIQVDTYAKQSNDISDISAFEQAHDVASALRTTWSRSASGPGDYDHGIDSIQEEDQREDFNSELSLYRVSNDYMVRVVPTATQSVTNGVITVRSNVIYRTKVTLDYSDFGTLPSAPFKTINLGFSLPPKGILHMITMQATTAFTGGSISGYSIMVGITGELDRYTANQSVFTLGLDNVYSDARMESMTATTVFKATATATGADLSAATAGEASFWIYYSTLN